ncbi:MAG: PIN domain-containing protein [Actinobacteria bacterium]|nr:PIN domain-containing protein [Actinomycetota bacterium]
MQYVDSNVLLKAHLDEPDSDLADAILDADPEWCTGRHTLVEVRRNLARSIESADLAEVRAAFRVQWNRMQVIELDESLCERAADLAEQTGARALDALHLAAADVLGEGTLPIVTFDRRLAAAARSLGWVVLGA